MRLLWNVTLAVSVAACSVMAATLVVGGCAAGPRTATGEEASESDVAAAPRNVILLIGDGMGPQQVALLLDWADAAGVAPTGFERLVAAGSLGLLRTGAAGSPLTDSASSGTALAAGVEVPNGFIAMDAQGNAVRTCLEDARDSGRATGLVTTTSITHATPACFAAHVPQRNLEDEIGRQLLTANVNVLLGGGARRMDTAKAVAAGYRVAHTPEELTDVPPGTTHLLGLFAVGHIPYAIDRDEPTEPSAPSLATMTQSALDVLGADPDGFFLMVEGGRIDHAGHINDAAALLGELREFDAAIGVAEAYRAAHPDTVVIVTADHETGGLGISFTGVPLRAEHLLAMTRVRSSLEAQAPPLAERKPVDPAVFGLGRRAFYPPYSWWETSRALERSAQWSVSFASQGHTTTPVPIAAAGPGATRFLGLQQNEVVGVALREWMSVPARPGAAQ